MRDHRTHLVHLPAMSRRSGVTLVEVLTVLGLIGLLLAILLPAVQYARSSSRRLQCANNQRQLILGVSSYLDAFGVFPPLASTGSNECLPPTPISRLFPHIELANICDILQSNVRRLPILECPADGDITLISTPLSYTFNASAGVGSGSPFGAPFDYTQVVGPRDVTDGMSNTVGISENVVVRAGGTIAEANRNPMRFGWSVAVPAVSPAALADPSSQASMAERATQTDNSIQKCKYGPRTFNPGNLPAGGQWGPGNFGGSWTYSHWYPPNSPACGASTSVMDTQLFLLNNRRAASSHAGGVNVAYMDGHQRFVIDGIDQTVWHATGTRNGNEANGE